MKDGQGAAAVTFAIALVPVLIVIGAAIDYSRWQSQQAQLRAAADASALAAANPINAALTPAEKAKIAQDFFTAQIGNSTLSGATASVVATPDSVTVQGALESRTFIASVMGKESQRIEVTSRAIFGAAPSTKARVLDAAMCIDSTSSMTNTISSVRLAAANFYRDLNAAIKARGLQPYDTIRLRLLAFRDYSFANGESYVGYPQAVAPALTEYPFQSMPADAAKFQANLDATFALSGGDTPESAMECLNAAMVSPWLRVGGVDPSTGKTIGDATPLIVMWSDTYSQPIPDTPRMSYGTWRKGNSAPSYPSAAVMPRTMSEFQAKWKNQDVIDQAAKMYVVFGVCQPGDIMHSVDSYGYSYSYDVEDGAWHFADIIRQLDRSQCGGTLLEGNDNMVNKLADSIKALSGAGTNVSEKLRLVQ